MNLIEAFDERASALVNMHYDEATQRLAKFIDWLESEPTTQRILETLRQSVDVESLIASDQQRPPRAGSIEEIAAVGLRLTADCRSIDFFDACHGRGIEPPYNTSALQDHCSDAVARYIVPFVNYVRRKLAAEALRYSIGGLSEGVVADLILSSKFERDFPSTHSTLEIASREFLRRDDEVAWQNVANSCRQALIDFCAELRSIGDFELTPETKAGDVKAILRQSSAFLGATGQFADSLERLIVGVWSHTQSLLHRGSTSKIEAIRLYLWTGLLIHEFTQLLDDRLSS
jgi:hypothetical protein